MDSAVWGALIAAGVIAAAVVWLVTRRSAESGKFADIASRLADAQAGLTGRLSQLAESQQAAQSHLQSQLAERLQAQERAVTKMLDERLAEVVRRVGENLQRGSDKAAESMSQLQAR